MNRRQFLIKSSASAALISSPALATSTFRRIPRPTMQNRQLTNWAGNIIFNSKKVYKPSTLSELQEVISRVEHFKIFGSLHSFNTIAKDDRAQISLENICEEIKIDSTNNRATIPGNMTIKEANDQLEKLGYSIPIMGEINHQTIAGAIATATHGSSLYHGTMSDLVSGITLINAQGEASRYTEDNPADEFILKALRVHLGALGAIWDVTIKVEPLYYLKREAFILDIESALSPALHQKHEYIQLYYMPFTKKAVVFTTNRIPKEEVKNDNDYIGETVLDNLVSGNLIRFSSLKPTTVPRLMNFLANSYIPRTASHVSHKMLNFKRNFKVLDMEFSVPYSETRSCLKTIIERIESEAKKNNYYWHLPIIIRFVKDQGTAYLNPTSQHGLSTYFSTPAHIAYKDKFTSSFKNLEQDLVSKHNARPHWGKHFWISPIDQYHEADKFRSVKEHLDPNGKFNNSYVNQWINN